MVLPKFGELQSVKQRLEEKNVEIQTRQNYFASLEKMSDDLDRHSDGLKKMETALPANPDVPAFMNFAQATAMQSGLILKSIDYSGQNKISDAMTLSAEEFVDEEAAPSAYLLRDYGISVTLSGSYANFKDFLSRIENSSRMIKVNSVGVSTEKESSSEEPRFKADKTGETGEVLEYTVEMKANYCEQP
jgi:Tfp pilus assembly protein PilO